ncbi:MAG: efflux transporter outer membrane subunit [Gammaproteobacteria bacterium]
MNMRFPIARVSALALGMLVSACSLAPAYVRPAAPVAASYPTGAAYKADAPAGESRAAADIGWRNFLTDKRLQQLVEVALHNNRDLRTAVLNVEQVRAQFRIESAALFPQVSAFMDRSRSRTPADLAASGRTENPGSYSVGASLSWELDFFGRLRNLKAEALEQYLASVQGQRAAQILLVSEVADQYLTLLADDEQLQVTRRTLEAARGSYAIVKLQFDTGAGNELDLRQAETVVEQALANEAAQLRARAQSENALVLLLGQSQPAESEPATSLDSESLLADIPAGLPSDLLIRRPDVLQAEALLRATNADIGVARANFFPHIELTASGGTASASLSGLFKAGSAAWSVAPAVTESVFDFGANRANLDVARVRKDIGVAQYEKAVQTAFREVADGLAARGTFDSQIAALERYTAAQRRRLELATLLYKNGAASYLDVLTAQTDLYAAEQVLVSARLERLTNLVDLYRSLGGGWIESS